MSIGKVLNIQAIETGLVISTSMLHAIETEHEGNEDGTEVIPGLLSDWLNCVHSRGLNLNNAVCRIARHMPEDADLDWTAVPCHSLDA